MTMFETPKMKIIEKIVLEKFQGKQEDGILVEKVYLTDGVITKHEHFENGVLVAVEDKEDKNAD